MSSSFNTLEYVKGAEAIGIPREQAEYLSKKIYEFLEKESHNNIIKYMIGIAITQSVLILTVMYYLFK